LSKVIDSDVAAALVNVIIPFLERSAGVTDEAEKARLVAEMREDYPKFCTKEKLNAYFEMLEVSDEEDEDYDEPYTIEEDILVVYEHDEEEGFFFLN
jgi:hypothetical protein